MGSSPSAQQEAVMMFDSYCKTVIMNCARRYWKREAKRSEHEYLVTDEQLAGHPANKDDFLEQYIITCGNIQAVFHCFALFTAIEQLKEKEKTVVVLKYWGGYTDKYIAQYLFVTERTVRNLKSHAYRTLKAILEKEDVADDADIWNDYQCTERRSVCNAADTKSLRRLYQSCCKFRVFRRLQKGKSGYPRTDRSRSYGCYYEMEG